MSTLEEISDTLRKQIEELELKIEGVGKMKGSERQQAVTRLQKQLKRTGNLIKTYNFTIQDSQKEPGIKTHISQSKEFQNKLSQLQKNLEYSRNQGTTEDQLFKHRLPPTSNSNKPGQRQQLIQKGHRVQQQGLQALKRIQKNIHIMDEQADSVNVELNRQIQQLDKIYDNLKDTETTLKRAQKHLKYFARQIYTDRLMICLIIVIIIAIIVIIILSAIGKTPNLTVDTIK